MATCAALYVDRISLLDCHYGTYSEVQDVKSVRKSVEVVQITFEDDLEVLAWLPPMRPPKENRDLSRWRQLWHAWVRN